MNRWTDWLGIELDVVSWREKAVAGAGGFSAILLLVWLSQQALGHCGSAAVVASMGASAVLLFAIPHGPLSQPWPVIGGHCISAFIGVCCARWLGHPALAAGCAVGLAVLAMHHFKCIHPPGGATALTAVLGGAEVNDLGFTFVAFPVLTNGLAMLALAVLFNWGFAWRRYPASLRAPAALPATPAEAPAPSHAEVVAALRQRDLFVDVSEEDLIELCRLISTSPWETRGARPSGE